MKLLEQYFSLQKEIYSYFGYVEDWNIIPLDDATDMYWILVEEPDGSGKVLFYTDPITQEVLDSGLFYSNRIYTQRFLPKWVYPGVDYTLVCVDTQTDGNKFLTVFSNDKKIDSKGLSITSWCDNETN